MKNKKNKKIFARVGAMVAAVLLVALCALPAFAEKEWSVAEVKECMYLSYHLSDYDPIRALTDYDGYDPNVYPYLFQVMTARIGQQFPAWNYLTIGVGQFGIQTKGQAMIWNTENDAYTLYEDCYIQSSYTTSSGYRFLYVDFYAKRTPAADSYERVLRLRTKCDVNDNTVVEVEASGDITGDATRLVIGFMCDALNGEVMEYLTARNILLVHNGVNVNYWNFYDGFRIGADTGYDEGYDTSKDYFYNLGYDDGLSQTSLMKGVTAIFRAPMELIDGVLNFELFGVNMAMAVRTLITMAIIGVCVTIIWKAVK